MENEQESALNQFANNSPIYFSIVITILFGLFVIITTFIQNIIDPGFPLALFASWVVILLLTIMEWWKKIGFNDPSQWRNMYIVIIPGIILILNFLGRSFISNIGQILGLLFIAVIIAFEEEAVFRGLVLKSNLPKSPFQAIIISSLLFGFVHIVNISSGAGIDITTGQIFLSVCMGILLASLCIHVNTIWVAIVIHTFWNFAFFISEPLNQHPYGGLYSLALILMIAIYGFILMYFIIKEQPDKHLGVKK